MPKTRHTGDSASTLATSYSKYTTKPAFVNPRLLLTGNKQTRHPAQRHWQGPSTEHRVFPNHYIMSSVHCQ